VLDQAAPQALVLSANATSLRGEVERLASYFASKRTLPACVGCCLE